MVAVIRVDTLVVGAGPAGLGAALVLDGADSLVVEALDRPGGLGRSVTRDGFTFDHGVHVLWSPHPEIEALYRDVLGPDAVAHRGRMRVHMSGSTCRYPIQSHLDDLPVAVGGPLVAGIERARGGDPGDFLGWCRANHGDALTDAFFRPYNAKVWACDPATLTSSWVSSRVPKAGGKGSATNFLYPRTGGVQTFLDRLAARVTVPIRYDVRLVAIDAVRGVAHLDSGETIRYRRVLASVPLPRLAGMCIGIPDDVLSASERLRASDVAIICLGVDRPSLGDGSHWDYVPDPAIPFQRVVYQSTIGPSNAPPGRSALMCEISHSPDRPLPGSRDSLVRSCVSGLVSLGILDDPESVSHASFLNAPGAYIPYTKARDENLPIVLEWLRGRDVVPIGRAGEWKYVNMDAAILSGWAAALSR